ncbi:serine/threonine protein kinase [Cytobacillus sp. S13-E01]|uniref:serine/threonine protein kinase n=1 Tax=Cytobacillus sp. S13-E01 TaxID=3031326 RepID=UPI0023D8AF6B|nr:serine/threonine protein kinase [Cytobacillus sp. S13-E01]MDF0728199.1 serine/threonine protein kinase [Cytobacillus sp. S13-E01]
MENKWMVADDALRKVKIKSTKDNDLISVTRHSEQLRCLGIGTDAAVFQHIAEPSFAFKVFADDKLSKMKVEQEVYEKLGNAEFFPIFYGTGSNYLVLSFEPGVTLYDCLLTGIHIPPQVLVDIEAARTYAFSKGLNPRDIHLKNILLHEGRAKLLDISEYLKPGDDRRWEYLKKGYVEYYHLIDRKVIPLWIIETVRKWFNQANSSSFDFQEFTNKLIKLFKSIIT